MTKRKEKGNKMAVRPSQEKNELTNIGHSNIWSEMDRMFDDFRSGFDNLFWPWRHHRSYLLPITHQRTPPLDIEDRGDRYEMQVEMPGIPKDKFNIEVTPTTIEISAEHDECREDSEKSWLRRERSSTSFYRALEFPEDIMPDDVEAEFNDGILKVSLPKREPKMEHKPRKVNIK
jgi:HSP20 family protein